MQSDISPGVAQQRNGYYALHPAAGPTGYLPSVAQLGSAQLVQALEDVHGLGTRIGEVLWTDVYTMQVKAVKSFGIDNCDRCGLRRPVSARSHADLRAGLSSLWPKS
jgi:hypothetical protein